MVLPMLHQSSACGIDHAVSIEDNAEMRRLIITSVAKHKRQRMYAVSVPDCAGKQENLYLS